MCDFPGCDHATIGPDYNRCEVHLKVMVSSSYLNGTEVADE
jgi:hypothetical protein